MKNVAYTLLIVAVLAMAMAPVSLADEAINHHLMLAKTASPGIGWTELEKQIIHDALSDLKPALTDEEKLILHDMHTEATPADHADHAVHADLTPEQIEVIHEFLMEKVEDMSAEELHSILHEVKHDFMAEMTAEESVMMMHDMMAKKAEGMTAEEKQEMMHSIMHIMMSQMTAEENVMMMHDMMAAKAKSMTAEEKQEMMHLVMHGLMEEKMAGLDDDEKKQMLHDMVKEKMAVMTDEEKMALKHAIAAKIIAGLSDEEKEEFREALEEAIPEIEEIEFKAVLSGDHEVPAVETQAWGQGAFELDTEENTLEFEITYSGLSSPETAAHIHGPAAPGENAGVVFPLPLGEDKEGTWTYDEEWEDDILSGMLYVNVHSELYPAGEIRGQIAVSE